MVLKHEDQRQGQQLLLGPVKKKSQITVMGQTWNIQGRRPTAGLLGFRLAVLRKERFRG